MTYDDYESIEDYLSNEVYGTTYGFAEEDRPLPDPGTPPEAVLIHQLTFFYAYNVIVVAIGIVSNAVLIKGILSSRAGGAFYFLLQIAIADVGTLMVSNWELHYRSGRSWTLPAAHCTVFGGLESLTSVAIVYFIVGLNFHSIATYNLAVDIATSAMATPEPESVAESLTDENSYEVAMADTVSQKRSLTIDYRYRKTRISALLPILLVWFIAVSESLPVFLFSDVVAGAAVGGEPETWSCTVLTNTGSNHYIVNLLVIATRIIIPTVALVLTSVLLVVKFYNGKHFPQPDEFDENVAFALKVSMFQSGSFAVFGLQRLYGSLLLEILAEPHIVPRYPLFNSTVGLVLTVGYYLGCVVRPLAMIVMCKQKHNHVEITFLCRKGPPDNTLS
ncbi:uncharacterized protein LOC131210357 [Anopheles bellator]|uniref:uncharacterized protein LOC131210357 n=1 Tax=Anopheles bellator TaxID=139047 RepID=UPI002649AA66|nr:uncharacterized protein LOC131210357 [Anopheles bellator]